MRNLGIREEALDKQRSVIVSKKKKKKISISLITSSLVLAGTLISVAIAVACGLVINCGIFII